MVFLKKVFVYLKNFVFLNPSDVFLISYPKSGNTWIRFYYCNLINEDPNYHFTNDKINFSILDNFMPEFGFSDLSIKWKFNDFPRIVKSHRAFSFLFKSHKSILLIRDPRDVMISFYEFDKKRKNSINKGNISEFIRNKKVGIEAWCKHYNSWKNKAGIIIKYEDLKDNDLLVFNRINDFLGIEVSQIQFENSVINSRFESIKKMELSNGLSYPERVNKDFLFARSGERGQWKNILNDNDLNFIYNTLNRYKINL